MDELTHYTRTIDAVVGILKNGFAWVPNQRKLISKLITGIDFSKREPQQFGMISFTDWTPPAPKRHRDEFGNFGILVSRHWAVSRKTMRGFSPSNVMPELRAQRVVYLEDGPVLEALRWIYTTEFGLLAAGQVPDSFLRLAATSPVMNKHMAAAEGEAFWYHLLTLYEYFELGEHAYQSEWRIVHPLPMSSYASTMKGIIESVTNPKGFAKVTDLIAIHASAEAILGFVCPREDEGTLRQRLPPEFSAKPIVAI